MPGKALSISEYTILGIVWRSGPCTTYTVMLSLAGSSSTFYRKRASSTYRVVHRLLEYGLLSSPDDELGSRGDRQIEITPEGAQTLQKWLTPPISHVEVAHSSDLIRLRIGFLSALDPQAQQAFIADALKALHRLKTEQEEKLTTVQGLFETIALKGAHRETQARIAWLEETKSVLSDVQ